VRGLAIAGLVGSGYDVTLFKWTPSFFLALGALAVLAIVHDPSAAGECGTARGSGAAYAIM